MKQKFWTDLISFMMRLLVWWIKGEQSLLRLQ